MNAGIEKSVIASATGIPIAAKVPIAGSPGKSLRARAMKARVVVSPLSSKEERMRATVSRGRVPGGERAWWFIRWIG